MTDFEWTPELEARCLEVARAARTEPETAESLRDALVASEAARLASEERTRVLGEALAAAKAVIDAGNRWAVDGTNSQRRVELREALFAYKLAARSLPAAPAEEPTPAVAKAALTDAILAACLDLHRRGGASYLEALELAAIEQAKHAGRVMAMVTKAAMTEAPPMVVMSAPAEEPTK